MTETGAEMNTLAIGEDLLAAMGADLPMTTAAAVEATTTVAVAMTMGLPEEDPAVAHLTTTIGTKINMDLRAHGVAIPTVRHAEGVAHRKTFAEAVAGIAIAIATAGMTARMRAFLEYHFWFVTSAPTSLTTTSVRHSDALVTFAMCTSRGITTRSKRKVLPLSNMQIQIRLVRHATK
jgi:hypothetical protein